MDDEIPESHSKQITSAPLRARRSRSDHGRSHSSRSHHGQSHHGGSRHLGSHRNASGYRDELADTGVSWSHDARGGAEAGEYDEALPDKNLTHGALSDARQPVAHRVHWRRRGVLSYKYSVRCWNCNRAYHASFRWGLSSRVSRCPYCKQAPRRLGRSWWHACFLVPLLAPLCAARNARSSPRAILEALEAGYLGTVVYGILISGFLFVNVMRSDYVAQERQREQETARLMHMRDKAAPGAMSARRRKLNDIEAQYHTNDDQLQQMASKFHIPLDQARGMVDHH